MKLQFLLALTPVILQGAQATLSWEAGSNSSVPQVAVAEAAPGTHLEFFDGVTPIGASTVDSSGHTSFALYSPAPGLHNISAKARGTGAPVGQSLRIAVPASAAGRFSPAAGYALGIQPLIFASGPLDPLGSVAFVAAGNGSVSIVKSPGGFSAPVVMQGVTDPVAVQVADFDGDGTGDIAVASASGAIAVYLNGGNGSFSSPRIYQSGGRPSGLAIADFNNDGIPDLAVANEAGNSVAVFAGRSDGSFDAPVTVDAGVSPRAIVAADVNADGLADLAVVSFSSDTVTVLLGDGHGSFRIDSSTRVGNGPSSLATGDFNEDGAADLAVFNSLDHTINLLINDGSGHFAAGAGVSGVISFAVGHVLGTAHLDLLVQSGAELQVLAGAGDGTFHSAAILEGSAAPQSLTVADFNGDGYPDVVAADLSGVMSVFAAEAVAGTPVMAAAASSRAAAPQAVISHALHSQLRTGSSIVLASSNTASNLGQTITLTATVTPSSATGSVTFYDGPSIIGIRALSGGQAVFSTNLLPSGANSLTARYTGDGTYSPSVSAAVSQTVTVLPQSGFSSASSVGAGVTPHGVVSGDFNNDGITDLAVADNAGTNGVTLFLGNGNGTFRAGVGYAANTQPFGLVAVDLNGDGNLDLAVTNANAAQVTVLIGSATGTFSTGGAYATGNNPQAIAAADFNGDGIADLVVANFTDGTLSVLLGNGDGSFQAASTLTVGTSPTSVAVADFNGDGKTDIVATNSGSSTVSVLMGNGDGTFVAGVTYAAGTAPTSVVAADLNGDGLVDLAIANALTTAGNVGVLLNKSAQPGTFAARTAFTAGNTPRFITVGDFNSDGITDLLVVNKGNTPPSGSSYSYLYGTGTGSFQAATTTALGNGPWSAVVGDFNGDGRSDVAIASSGDNKLYLIMGAGLYPNMTVTSSHSANFTQGQTGATYTLTASNVGAYSTSGLVSVTDALPAALAATAMSGDGWACTLATLTCTRSDVLLVGQSYPVITLTVTVASNAAQTVTNSVTVAGGGEIILSDDSATDPTTVIQTTTLSLTSSVNPSTSGSSVSFTATISTSAATGTVVFYDGPAPLATGLVTAGTGMAVLNTALLTAGTHVVTARYSGDSQYQASSSPAVVQVVNSQLQNGFQAGTAYALGVTNPSGVAIADFNGDGKADIVATNSSSTSKVLVLLGHGDGTFANAVAYAAGGANSDPFAIVAADFNGDGNMDVAVANSGTNNVSVLIGNGDGTFKPAVNSAAGTHPEYLVAGDFNRDGIPDLAVADYNTGIVSVLLGKGDGTFQSPKTNTVGTNPRGLALRDFNGDGFTDIAVANYGSNSVSLLLGNGDGTFTAGAVYTVGTNPQSVAAGDLNGDGIPDLAVANNGSNSVTVLLGNGDGTFNVVGSASGVAAGTNPTGVVINDFNGDGIGDLALSDAGGGVSLLLGVGDGTFQAPLSYAAGTTPVALATADLDGDGTSDLAVANQGSGNITVLLGGLFYSDVIIASSHTGNFTQGQTGAQYSLAVSNIGQYPTAGTVTASDTLPAGLTATAIAGPGWNCTLAGLSCTRNDALVPGASYPSIVVTVNVSKNAAQQVTNTARVAGGHENNATNDTATDATTVVQQTTLSLVPSSSQWVYGQAVTLIATVSQSSATGTVTFSQDSTTLGTVAVSGGTASIAAPSLTPGTWQFTAVYSGDAVYGGSNTMVQEVIGKATATVTLSGLSAAWDGTPKSVTVTTNPTGLNFSVTYNGSATAPSNAGSYTVIATVNDTNYAGSATASLVITPAQATVALSTPSATYDGNPHGATATTTPTGLSVSITYGGWGTVPVAAGTYPVTATVTAPNYAGTATGTLIISPAPVTITLSGLSAVYDGTPKAVSVTTNPANVTTAVTYNGKATVPSTAGSYTVSVSIPDTNYSGSASGTLIINKAAASFALSNLVWVYDGTQKSAQVTPTPAGVVYSVTYNGVPTPPSAAGVYALAVTANDPNYSGSASTTFTIQKATPVITWPQPAALTFGTPLTAGQLNASTVTAGNFTYTPGLGTVLPIGASQPLSAAFAPFDSNNYNSVTVSTTITINAANANKVSIVSSKLLSRDANNNIVVAVTFANTGTADANNVTVTTLKIGTVYGTPLPLSLGTIPAGTFAQATFTVAGSGFTPGGGSSWSVAGTFTGGSFSTAGKVGLP